MVSSRAELSKNVPFDVRVLGTRCGGTGFENQSRGWVWHIFRLVYGSRPTAQRGVDELSPNSQLDKRGRCARSCSNAGLYQVTSLTLTLRASFGTCIIY